MLALALQGLSPRALCRALPTVTLPEARKIVAQVHRDEAVETPMSGVSRRARDAVSQAGAVPTLEVLAERKSAIDPFVKYAMRTADGHTVESVRIPLEKKGRYSVCVSSQVGCALACAFCATGKLGLRRNLETWEMVEQVRIVRRHLPDEPGTRVHGVVFQGMGEPMSNLDRVLAAIEVMMDPCALAIDARNITVSTAGLPTGIRRLAREAPKVRLAVSIGTAIAGARKKLMPIDGAHPFEEVLEAAAEHAKVTGLSPLWAVTLLAGVNDSDADASALAGVARAFAEKTGVRPRISVIPYNPIDGDPFRATSLERETSFRDVLGREGLGTHKRYSGGGDVAAACGQLAAKG